MRFIGASKTLIVVLSGVLVIGLLGAIDFYRHPLSSADALVRFNLWRQGVHSRNVVVDGYRIHYFEALPPSNSADIPLVLVHGLGSRGDDWAPLIPSLASAGFHVYAPDLLGYGRSSKPNVSYSITLEEKIVVGFIETLQIPKADIGGWSMGGWIAAKLALDNPELVQRLVLYDAAGIYFRPTFDTTLFVPTNTRELNRLTAMLEPDPKPLPAFVARAALRRLQKNGWVVQRSVNRMLDGRDLLDFRLDTLRTPTLIVWGAADRLIPVSVADRMHKLIASSSLDVIQNAGHLAPTECPKSTLRATVGFLSPPHPAVPLEVVLPCK